MDKEKQECCFDNPAVDCWEKSSHGEQQHADVSAIERQLKYLKDWLKFILTIAILVSFISLVMALIAIIQVSGFLKNSNDVAPFENVTTLAMNGSGPQVYSNADLSIAITELENDIKVAKSLTNTKIFISGRRDYVGCYIDGSNRDLPFIFWDSPNMYAEICINHCLKYGYRYAGTQFYDECWCGNQYGSLGKAAESDCNAPCTGNAKEMCGGANRNSVYSTGGLAYTPETSCAKLRNSQTLSSSYDGIYYLKDSTNTLFSTYCDMTTDDGGWTLVATIHENNLGPSGRCTSGDKWSSEQGNTVSHPDGDLNWANRNVFGHLMSATSADYKNSAFFEMAASDIMIWQVPNDTPRSNFKADSYLRYRTTNGFMKTYTNLYRLFKDYYPLTNNRYDSCGGGNGPSVFVRYDKGDLGTTLYHFGNGIQDEVEAGYLQFRAIGQSQAPFAMCMGVRPVEGACNPQHYCVGSAGHHHSKEFCGDFAALDADGYGTGQGNSADKQLTESVYMIFYR
ncbi:intelectin-1a-like isoform X2 [Clavelina lepadiformis]|uniref:intelectin-1a-like isoform X2 n=1 Tax=Clavelina lepadiformis TaxID=159417 RepID=UPI0040438BEE